MRNLLNLVSVGFAVFNVGAAYRLERKRRQMAETAEFLRALWSLELERFVNEEGDGAE
jgi:hypothetical protein